MALSSKVGNFAQPTSVNHAFAVTGVGFTPKVIILFSNDKTSDGNAAIARMLIGMATSTTNRMAQCATTDNSGNMVRSHYFTKCYMVASQTAGTLLAAADLVSFDSDGFTLDFGTVDSTARKINYIALGGSDLTNAFIKQFKPAGSTGDQSFTGVGFLPDSIIMVSPSDGFASDDIELNADNLGFGFADSAKNNRAMGINADNSTSAQNTGWQKSVLIEKVSSSAPSMEATLKTYDSDGFTLNFTAASSVKYCYALCLKGLKTFVGVFNQATSTGNQSVTGVGFQPELLLLFSRNAAAGTTANGPPWRESIGAGISSSSRFAIFRGGNATSGSTNSQDLDSTKVLKMMTPASSPTTEAASDLVSLDSDGFTINNTIADATAREIAYMVFGSNAVVAASGGNGMMTTNSRFWGT